MKRQTRYATAARYVPTKLSDDVKLVYKIRMLMTKGNRSLSPAKCPTTIKASEMLAVARENFAGACLMPPFDHYEVLFEILRD